MSEAPAELMSFFEASEYDTETVDRYMNAAYESARNYERFGELVAEYSERGGVGENDALRIGIGYLILGRYQQALEWFEKSGQNQHRFYYAGQAAAELHRLPEAIENYKRAGGAGWDSFEIDILTAELLLRSGDVNGSKQMIQQLSGDGQDRGEWHYARGLLAEKQDARNEAIEYYEKALDLSPDNTSAMFRAAWLYDLRGDDEEAIELYQRLAMQPCAHVNALINLAVIYEDNGKFDDALSCLQRVLAAYPNHTRARLFLQDVESSREMVIDDTIEKQVETRNRMLETPVSEFELSVRARNCLKKMNIQTLGDLLKLSETELLSYKNFGETSLTEISALLQKRGLRLGQKPEEIDTEILTQAPAPPKVSVPPGSEALLTRPVSEMELSVRARRCLQRLNIDRVSDLIQRTEAELLATRNFGSTSLTEIKARLQEWGLTLAAKG